jgi:hypothetical protein
VFNRTGVRVLAAAVTASVIAVGAGCRSTASPPPPKTTMELRKLLLSQANVPTGVKVLDLTADHPGDTTDATQTPTGPICDDLISVVLMLNDDSNAVPAATANVAFDVAKPGLWTGSEFVFSYHDGEAHRALADLKSLVTRCPTDETGTLPTAYSLGHDPQYGDEGAYLRTSVRAADGKSFEKWTALIRVGNDLIVVKSDTPDTADAPTPLDGLVKAAYRVFTAG